MGTLFLVATPIGNLEDMSARAVRVLREAGLIAAEDTRQTRKLLTHFDVHTPLTSYFEHNKLKKLDAILAALAKGDVALVSDAGTPAINDPGVELVRAALEAGHTVSPVPGPSAPVAALAASGLPTDSFLYLGYLPRKTSERRACLERVANLGHTLIFLESPHRLSDSLADLETILGDRQIAVARELTKLHEEIWRGLISGAKMYFHQPRGEFTLVVAGAGRRTTEHGRWSEKKLLSEIKKEVKSKKAAAQIASELAEQSGWPRREVYRLISKNSG